MCVQGYETEVDCLPRAIVLPGLDADEEQATGGSARARLFVSDSDVGVKEGGKRAMVIAAETNLQKHRFIGKIVCDKLEHGNDGYRFVVFVRGDLIC